MDLAGVRVVGTLQVEGEIGAELAEGDQILRPRGSYARAWTLAGRAGQLVTIEMLNPQPGSISFFDPYLYVAGPGLAAPLADDDGGNECDARITLIPPGDGDYRVVATTHRGVTGPFTLRVGRSPRPVTNIPCNLELSDEASDSWELPCGDGSVCRERCRAT